MKEQQAPVTIFWFRRDLRLDDNHGLFKALQERGNVLPVFIFDEIILGKLKHKDARVEFIHDEVKDLKNELEKYGSSLLARYGKPAMIFRNMLEKYHVAAVYSNHDYEPYASERDEEIKNILAEKNIPFRTYKDQVIFEKNEILKEDGGPYTVFTPYAKKWLRALDNTNLESFSIRRSVNNFFKTAPFPYPSLEELGFSNTDIPVPPREMDTRIIENYHKTRDYPGTEGTSRLGVHLRFGTISIRQLVKTAARLNTTFLGELIWREFYMMVLWHFPDVVDHSFHKKYDRLPWINDEPHFRSWCEGKTGYPMVDAGMRELNSTGYMHNRVRMITASFLTKHLLTDWRWGEAYFAEKLVDYELSSNNGGWQWAAGTGTDAAPYFRIFNPSSQAEKFDPEQRYIRKWIPEYGTDSYPGPIVDHKKARQRALDAYKAVNRQS